MFASFNGRFKAYYQTYDIDYLAPVMFDEFCFIAPKALQIPQWMAMFKCFSINVWCVIVLMNIICGYFWYLLKQWTLL